MQFSQNYYSEIKAPARQILPSYNLIYDLDVLSKLVAVDHAAATRVTSAIMPKSMANVPSLRSHLHLPATITRQFTQGRILGRIARAFLGAAARFSLFFLFYFSTVPVLFNLAHVGSFLSIQLFYPSLQSQVSCCSAVFPPLRRCLSTQRRCFIQFSVFSPKSHVVQFFRL